MDIAIYGMNEITKDFLYLFETLHIGALFYDFKECPNFEIGFYKGEIKSVIELKQWYEKNKVLVVICGLDYIEKENILEEYGLMHKENYIYAHEMGKYLIKEMLSDKAIAWYGSTKYLYIIKKFALGNEYLFFSSKNKAQKCMFLERKYWIVDLYDDRGFIDICKKNDMKERENFINVQNLLDLDVENLLNKVFYENRQYKNFKCAVPFRMISVSQNRLHTCCGGRLPLAIGNSLQQDFQEIWFSLKRKILCLSVLNGTYAFCNQNYCPLLHDISHSEKKLNYIHYAKNEGKLDYKKLPDILQLEFDGACNLACPSCRKHYLDKDKYRNKEITKYVLSEIVSVVKEIRCAGFGEALYSRNYLKILSDNSTRNKSLYLLTNGLLLNELKLNELTQRFAKVAVDISVDAGSIKIYSKTRGASFEKLFENLEMLSEARKNNKFSEFVLNFTISKINIMDLENFVQLAKSLHVDYVRISAVHNWGIWSEEEFERMRILDDNYQLKEEVKRYFVNSVMQSDFVLDNNVGFKNDR